MFTHSLVLLGVFSILPKDPATKIAYFMLDISMGALVLATSRTDRGSLWGILYGINIVNHFRGIAFLLGQSDDFMTDVYFLADNPIAIDVSRWNHIWYIIGTLVDIVFHSWNVHFLLFSMAVVTNKSSANELRKPSVSRVRRRYVL